ncbi:Cyclophilin-like domain containing protein [Tylopilus felleus]
MALPMHGCVIVSTTVGEIDIELWSKQSIIPGFLVQTGDRTGMVAGGESFYGEPFEDENLNESQFFIMLDQADELHGKHTLFGRVVGDTLYNVLKIGKMANLTQPQKIKSIIIVDNPFPDIIPHITAAEKCEQQHAQEAEQCKGAKKSV